jgi:hypothetical protein
MMEHYILLQSNAYDTTYPENTPYHFYADISDELLLDERWKVGLVQLVQNREQDLYIYSNVCQESFVNKSKASLLRYLSSKDNLGTVYYHYVKYFIFHKQIEIKLQTSDGSLATFLNQPTVVVLHLKRFPI